MGFESYPVGFVPIVEPRFLAKDHIFGSRGSFSNGIGSWVLICATHARTLSLGLNSLTIGRVTSTVSTAGFENCTSHFDTISETPACAAMAGSLSFTLARMPATGPVENVC